MMLKQGRLVSSELHRHRGGREAPPALKALEVLLEQLDMLRGFSMDSTTASSKGHWRRCWKARR